MYNKCNSFNFLVCSFIWHNSNVFKVKFIISRFYKKKNEISPFILFPPDCTLTPSTKTKLNKHTAATRAHSDALACQTAIVIIRYILTISKNNPIKSD